MKSSSGKFVKIGISILLLATALFFCFQTLTVEALVPTITTVSYHDVGSTTWADITVFHDGSPTPIGAGHYVSNIRLDINGTVQNLAQSPQSSETFTVQYSLGPNSNKYSIRAQALCNQHGYGAYSNIVVVPEFSFLAAALFLVFTTTTILVGRKIHSQKKEKLNQ